MQKASRLLCLFSLTVLFFTAPIKANTPKSDYGAIGGMVTLPKDARPSEVQNAIVQAALARGWVIKSSDDIKVVIFHQTSNWVSQLTLLYDDKTIDIFSNSSRKGKVQLPESWIDNLRKDIIVRLKPKSAAPAVAKK